MGLKKEQFAIYNNEMERNINKQKAFHVKVESWKKLKYNQQQKQ